MEKVRRKDGQRESCNSSGSGSEKTTKAGEDEAGEDEAARTKHGSLPKMFVESTIVIFERKNHKNRLCLGTDSL